MPNSDALSDGASVVTAADDLTYVTQESLGRATAAGASTLLFAAAAVQLIGLASGVIVARHLMPGDYGVVAVAQTTLAFAQVLGGLGLAPAIAAGRLRDPGNLAAASVLLTAFGLVLCAAYAVLSPAIAAWFGVADASRLLQVAGLSLPLSFANVVPLSILQRELKFGRLGMLAVAPQFIASALAILLAIGGAGVWALVVPGLVAASCSTIGSTILVRQAIWSRPKLAGLSRVMAESGSLLGFQILNYAARQGDNLIIGRWLGPLQLGIYSFAYGQLTRPLSLITGTVSNALVPAIGRVVDDRSRLSRGVTLAVTLTARVAAPVFVGGALVSERLVILLFGHRWLGALPLIRVFLLLALPQAIASLLGTTWVAVGAARVLLVWQSIVSPIMLIVFGASAKLGGSAYYVGLAYAVTSTLLVPVVLLISAKVAGLDLRKTTRSLGRIGLDVTAMSVVVLSLGWALAGAAAPSVLILLSQVAAGMLVYIYLFRRFSSEELLSLLDLLPSALRPHARRLLRAGAP